jgi:uncharacterized membrane protein
MWVMEYQVTVPIDAPAATIWPELADVERWPEWTTSIRSVRRLDAGPLAVGSRAKVKQPRLPTTVWEVTALEPDREFTWVAKSPGVRTVAVHRLEPRDGHTDLTLTLRQEGALGGLMARMLGGLTRRYVDTEANGLKRRAESRTRH